MNGAAPDQAVALIGASKNDKMNPVHVPFFYIVQGSNVVLCIFLFWATLYEEHPKMSSLDGTETKEQNVTKSMAVNGLTLKAEFLNQKPKILSSAMWRSHTISPGE